ncbi:MAG: hypothetical protein ACHP65_08260, partial [Legionellales bacterium]
MKTNHAGLFVFLSEQILSGDYSNLPLLSRLFDLPAFTEDSSKDPVLSKQVSAIAVRCEESALEKNAHAMFLRGAMFTFGIGSLNYAQAIHYYEQAIKLKHPVA